MTIKSGEIVVAAVKGITKFMFAIRCKIISLLLGIISIKRADGKKWRHLKGQFQVGRMRIQSPVIEIITVIGTNHYFIAHEIIGAKTNRHLYPLIGQVFYT